MLHLALLVGDENVEASRARASIAAHTHRFLSTEHAKAPADRDIQQRPLDRVNGPHLNSRRLLGPAHAGHGDVHRPPVQFEIVQDIHVVGPRAVGDQFVFGTIHVVGVQPTPLVRAEDEALLGVLRMNPNSRIVRRVAVVRHGRGLRERLGPRSHLRQRRHPAARHQTRPDRSCQKHCSFHLMPRNFNRIEFPPQAEVFRRRLSARRGAGLAGRPSAPRR